MIRVGVVGCKGIGIQHATGAAGLESTELAAGCDLVEDARAAFHSHWKERFPRLQMYGDHREMLAEAKLDVVTVATSDHRHADIVVDAAEAGVRGVFCEKPLATSVQDADRMLEACRANGTVLAVDHTRRWQPLWRAAHERVWERGEIGAVQYVVGTLNGSRAMLFRNGTHLIDAVCWFAGSKPDWVFAHLEDGYEHYTEYAGDGGHDPKTEPSASGYIHFENGVRGFYAGGTKRGSDPKFRIEVVGSGGYLLLNDRRGEFVKSGESTFMEPPSVDGATGIQGGVQELIGVVENGGAPASTGEDGAAVVEIFCGFLESQRLGNARVALPLARS
ncbi:MAG: Gfo/Idh/MocA family oxidoreductase [Candidatus Poribacteria bacterium]|nr:Gfo/Idh/MocA family oxidoreductase [Candidatus Poribacteria bacterium]